MADDDVPTPVVIAVLGCVLAIGTYLVLPVGSRQLAEIAPEIPVVSHTYVVQTVAHTGGAVRQEKAEPDDDAVNICRDRHPKDYNMRDVCEKGEKQARFKAKTFQIDYDVGVLCAKINPANWTYYTVCARKQMDAKQKPDEKPTRPNFSIEEMCALEYPEDFKLIRYCEKQQDEAQNQAGSWIPDNIARKCTGEWSANWHMFMYCVKQQVGAEGFTDPERHIRKPALDYGTSSSRRDRARAMDDISNAPAPRRRTHTSTTSVQAH